MVIQFIIFKQKNRIKKLKKLLILEIDKQSENGI